MPQLDIYTFSTQIYFIAVLTFIFLALISYTVTYVFFFESELFEKDELTLTQMPITNKYESLILRARFNFLSQRFADIVALFVTGNTSKQ